MTNAKPYVVVVGIDFSESSDLALERALEIASTHDSAEVHALNVVHLVMPAGDFGYLPTEAYLQIPIDVAEEQLRGHVVRRVEAFRESHARLARTLPRVLPHLRLQAPADELAQLAADLEADLVVVGTHGRRGVSRAMLGSVAEAVVRLAPCPVLVVRPRRVVELPKIEPPCPECVSTRRSSNGERFWCDQHSERHGQRHTYHQGDRVGLDGTMPLVFHE
jgi:nucleotide-binding universal stress UspA family protein